MFRRMPITILVHTGSLKSACVGEGGWHNTEENWKRAERAEYSVVCHVLACCSWRS